MFLKTHDSDLLKEDERLEDMNMFTKRWWKGMGRGIVSGDRLTV
jgi:hypothetical protein